MDKLNYKKGFSTIEIMIAMVLIILALGAALMVSSGNQSILIDGETNAEALNLAQKVLENEQALARKDFKLVNYITTTEPIGSINYTKDVTIETQSDFFTKKVTAKISWPGMFGRNPSVSLTSLVTNFENAVGGDTCDSNLSGDWKNPEIESTINFSSMSPAGTYTLTDVDAYKGKLYVTAGKTTNNPDPTLFVFNISDSSNTLIGKVDNASAVTSGLNAIHVAEDTTTNKIYAYAASNTGSDYSTCDPVANPACGQLYVFDVTNPTPVKTANLKITSSPAITGQTTGTSIFYKNGYVFLGLRKTSGPEFHIIDAHNPSLFSNSAYSPIGSFETGHAVNDIFMSNNFAYLATANDVTEDQDLQILDISTPSNPYPGPVGSPYGFDPSSGGGSGKSIYQVGDKLYLGKTTQANSDFYILDDKNPASTLPALGPGVDVSSSVNGIVVRDYLSFLLTGTSGTASQLQIFKTDDPLNITPWNASPLLVSATGNDEEPSMDCEGNRLYISSNDSTGQGTIYVIKPGA